MSHNKSNLPLFFLFCLINITFCSCSKDTNVDEIIPYTYVKGTIYLDFYSELNSVGNALYFDEIDASVGYNGHGFIVVRTSTSEFTVFDATCTNDKDSEEHLKIEGSYAECPVCGSKFSLLTGGWPFNDSEAKYKLKEYRNTYYSGNNTLKIRN
ncbi:Rieske (2Fe-2S) protein [Labilibaculum euxinus]